MFERTINQDEVERIANEGEVIADYPNDTPYPSLLLLGFAGKRPIHVVVAVDATAGKCYIVTAYEPSSAKWAADFKARKKS